MGAMAWLHPNFIVLLILLMSLPRLWMLFRAKTDAEKRYFEVSSGRRWTMAVLYFGLVVLLVLGMRYVHLQPPAREPALVSWAQSIVGLVG